MYELPDDTLPNPIDFLANISADSARQEVRVSFEKSCNKISKHWLELLTEEKNGTKKRRPSTSANSFLRENIYRLGQILRDTKQVEPIRKFFPDERRRRKDVPSLNENIFYWILIHLYGDDTETMPVPVRNRISKQLEYASRHGIPPYLLVGFLYQISEPEHVAKRLKTNLMEKWYSSAS